jgi:hypothetical protein
VQLLPEIYLILRRTERDMFKNVYWTSCTVPLFLSDFDETGVFSTDFRKMLISNFMKVRVVGAELFRVDGETDGQTTKLIAFRNFAKAYKNWVFFSAECGNDAWNEPHRKIQLSVITRKY